MSLGERVFVESLGVTGTVRWSGYLEGSKSLRVGVEQDKPTASGHDGRGKFACKSNTGVFVKQDKVNRGISVLEAVRKRYSKNNESNEVMPSTGFQLVGESKAAAFFNDNMHALEDLCLDSMGVKTITGGDELTNVKRLSLCGNLLEDIRGLDRMFPNLQELDLSDNVDLTLSGDYKDTVFPSLTHIRLDRCVGVQFRVFCAMAGAVFVGLKELSFKGMDLGNPGPILENRISLESLLISNSGCWESFGCFAHFLGNHCFPENIQCLDISGCGFSSSVDGVGQLWERLPSLTSLNIGSCGLETHMLWLSLLSASVPLLKSLRVSGNPFYDKNQTKWRQILITAFPCLGLLNGAIVRPAVRLDAERYCVSLLRKNDSVADGVLPGNIKYEILQKYPNIGQFSAPVGVPSPSSHQSSLMSLVVKNGNPNGSDLILRIPRNCSVPDLYSTVCRRIQWPMNRTELGISARAPTAAMEDQVTVSEEHGTDVADFGIEDGWVLLTYVRG